ncbi:polyprenyl synthetase family protein [Nigerium massiliense]|uniref:polyprenyl synthetase family protein n=1 Tax=Nigerium massiliense TaxID=1522317 RepID=UPI00058E07D6|nr:polyprenyl synthetase family protein [Nigerium massiliense]
MVTLDSAHPVDQAFRDAVSRELTAFLDAQEPGLRRISARTAPLLERARLFTGGGKRLRPAFCAWAYAAVAGSPGDEVLRAAASLDLLHVSALVHDDVMDASDTRRGVPAAHRQFEADHREAGLRGDSEAFGHAGAILLGDLLLVWSDELFRSCGLPAADLRRAERYLEAVRTEVTVGQYLDVLAQAHDPYAISRTPDGLAELVEIVGNAVTYKSASYTIRRPLDIGGALAGASEEQHAVFAAYGQPLGRAFQYRDDLLGVFGDEALTGKDSGEDLREGKLTLLVAHAFGHASDPDARRLSELFGRPDLGASDIDAAREIIVASGAREMVEQAIEREYTAAVTALEDAPLREDGRRGLRALADVAVHRAF